MVGKNPAATERMTANSTQMADSIRSNADITEKNSDSTQDASAASEEMSAGVEQVVASTRSLDQMAQQRKRAVSAFTLGRDGGTAADLVE